MDEVLFTQEKQLGIITLNRSLALNALTFAMICALQKQLAVWKKDDTVKAVVIKANPGKAFCAGGDVRTLYLNQGKLDQQMQFFEHEYRLNLFIQQLGKPYIALMDGITMGGGVGISLHGSHPVASEHFVVAMPETGIGFFPDVGASYLLSRCPGYLGIYLGLTGNRLTAAEALEAGLINCIIESVQMPKIIEGLHKQDLSVNAYAVVDQCLKSLALPVANLAEKKINGGIDAYFSQPTVEKIIEALEASTDSWSKKTKEILQQKSPLSLKITLLQLQKAKGLSLAECLAMDLNLARHFMQDSDFYEGVRALLIDKDKNPHWELLSLEEVCTARLDKYFEYTVSTV